MSTPVALEITSCNADDARFLALVGQLDQVLEDIGGEEQAWYDQFSDTDTLDYVVLATIDGEAVGCGALRAKTGGRVEVKRMYTAETARGRGVARAVLGALEAFAKTAGHTQVVLETYTMLHAARAMYERLGYEVIDCYAPYVGMPLSVCYGKDL